MHESTPTLQRRIRGQLRCGMPRPNQAIPLSSDTLNCSVRFTERFQTSVTLHFRLRFRLRIRQRADTQKMHGENTHELGRETGMGEG